MRCPQTQNVNQFRKRRPGSYEVNRPDLLTIIHIKGSMIRKKTKARQSPETHPFPAAREKAFPAGNNKPLRLKFRQYQPASYFCSQKRS